MTEVHCATDVAGTKVRQLIELAQSALPVMQLADGAFCFERRLGEGEPFGRSLRYTLMVELGLLRAQMSGYRLPLEVDELESVVWREIDASELKPGDLGLMLWIDARRGGRRGPELTKRLEAALSGAGGLPARVGMELAWIVAGLAHHVAAGGDDRGRRLLAEALDQLLVENRARSQLFRHFGAPGWRRRFPNFATQIYSVLALAVVARNELDERALPAARATADRLLELQLADGGWPWLFDVERGSVVEPYEVYSVHQDAMAPMALLELSEAAGDERYVRAVARGLRWIHRANELGADMVDAKHRIVLRSIRRRRGLDRLWLAAKTGASLVGLPTPPSTARLTEINRSDRPYHFGWVLEAWCGRETALSET